MLTITQNSANTLILTLTERTTLSSPIFLFVFTSEQMKQSYACIAADTSNYTYRYNEFVITEKAIPDTLSGEINIPYPGEYTYEVYEQSSGTNLDPANATTLLETGVLKVKPDTSATNTTYDSEPKTNTIYGS